MRTSTAEHIRNFNRMSQKNLVSPAGRVNKNDSSSPTDRTVAETPSPGGKDMFSPDTVKVKVVEESPKPEGQPDFESVWNADSKKKVDTRDRLNKNKRAVSITGRKSSFHARYLNQIMNGDSTPEREPVPAKDNERTKAPVPFLSTGSPIESSTVKREAKSFKTQEEDSRSPSLKDEIALAQKLGMAETLATVPESAQRALMMKSISPSSALNTSHFVASPSNTVEMTSVPLSPVEDMKPLRPHSLFQSSENNKFNPSYDKIDEILDRKDSDHVQYRYKANERKSFKASGVKNEVEEESDLPFDCTVENMNDLQSLEEGKSFRKMRNMLYRKFLRNDIGPSAGNAVKKECRGTSDLDPNHIVRTLRDDSVRPSETKASFGGSKKDKFEDETFSPRGYNAANKIYEESEPIEYTIHHTIDRDESSKRDKKSSSEKKGRSGLRTCLYMFLLVLLLIVGVLAGLVAGGKLNFWSKEDSIQESNQESFETSVEKAEEEPTVSFSEPLEEIPIEEATLEPTFIPTEVIILDESNVFEGSKTVACSNAVPLTEMDRPYYGSNWKAFWDASIDTCGDQMSTGYAVWYSFSTNSSKLVQASTCDNADFDTQLTVMSGSCEATTCVSFNDQACGDQSLVTWYAEANTTYYIMVHGFREASGTFGLTLSEAFQNDQRYNATKLEDGTVVAGTTAGANSTEMPPECGNVDLSGDGVWYEIENVAGFYKAELLLGYTEFSGQVAVYRTLASSNLDSDELICDRGSSTGSVIWLAEATQKYYIYVIGKNETAGDFDLFVGRNKDASCTFATRVDPNSVGFLASTRYENPQNVESCGYTGYHTAPGLWFSVVGTGEMLEASTCGSSLDLDTQISVFGNSCDTMECIGGTGQDIPCGDNGSVSWQTEFGEVYNIYVSGRSSRVGDFVLNINEVPVADGFTCDGSLPVDIGTTYVKSNITSAPSDSVELCNGERAVRGVWHKFVGTGMTMKFSACNNGTDFDARLSLFTGSCGGLSCVAHTESVCGENDEILATTHVGMDYYLFVHGSDSVSIGNYHLTIEEEQINDSCATSSSLELTGSPQYFGSTLSASNSTAIGCSGEPAADSGGLWYSFVGTGEPIILSTCTDETDFSTDIRVYTGICSEFVCVPDISITKCGDQSMISFLSTIDEIYYARVGGVNASEAGSFILDVNPRSKFFGA